MIRQKKPYIPATAFNKLPDGADIASDLMVPLPLIKIRGCLLSGAGARLTKETELI